MGSDDDKLDEELLYSVDHAWDLIGGGDLKGAMAIAQRSLERDGDSPDAHHLAGVIHASEGNTELALAHYMRAIEADEFFFDATLNAAELLFDPVQDHHGALRLAEKALSLADLPEERAEALALKTEILCALGGFENVREARRMARRFPKTPLKSARACFALGRASYELGDFEEAVFYFQEALALQSGIADTYHLLGLTYLALRQKDEAIYTLLKTRELDEALPPPPFSLKKEAFEGRVRDALSRLSRPFRDALEGALFVVAKLPGVEVVAEGIDPRTPILLDDIPQLRSGGYETPLFPIRFGKSEPEEPRVGRVFVYQATIERSVPSAMHIADEIVYQLERAMIDEFPELEAHATHPLNRQNR